MKIKLGTRVVINSKQMEQYRKNEVGKFIGKEGRITNIDFGYQDETMYSVCFGLYPHFIQALFFEHEITEVI